MHNVAVFYSQSYNRKKAFFEAASLITKSKACNPVRKQSDFYKSDFSALARVENGEILNSGSSP